MAVADAVHSVAQKPSLPRWIIGVDEAGRGPLAGPVVAAAVLVAVDWTLPGLACSKTLSPARRERLQPQIIDQAVAWSVQEASVEEIDGLNILQATLLAMHRAVSDVLASSLVADHQLLDQLAVLIDGNQLPRQPYAWPVNQQSVVKGDQSVQAISAASILAKTHRDALCMAMHKEYPDYAFDEHKGYGTALHVERLRQHGPCRWHRRSFAPVKAAMSEQFELTDRLL